MTSIDRRTFLATGAAGLLGTASAAALAEHVQPCEKFAPANNENDDAVFRSARQRFLFSPDVTYCNTGTLGASPCDVVNTFIESLERLETELPEWPYYQADGEPLTGYQEQRTLRERVGQFINARYNDIALVQNATMGMSLLAAGLEMQAGDEVLTTDQEHSGGIGGWQLRAARSGIVVRELPLSTTLDEGPEAVVDMFAAALTPRTRVIMFSHITSQLGIRLPARELCELARRHGALAIVDGAQAIGQISVDVGEIGCDAYVASPHKWLLAPKGTGFFYIHRDLQPRVWSTLASSHYDDQEAGAFRFMQYGTGSVAVANGLAAALNFILSIGSQRIERWDHALNARLRHGLADIPSASLTSPDHAGFAAAITTFRVEGRTASELQDALWNREKIRVRAQGDDKGVRLCCHLYVDPSDIDRALEVVASLA